MSPNRILDEWVNIDTKEISEPRRKSRLGVLYGREITNPIDLLDGGGEAKLSPSMTNKWLFHRTMEIRVELVSYWDEWKEDDYEKLLGSWDLNIDGNPEPGTIKRNNHSAMKKHNWFSPLRSVDIPDGPKLTFKVGEGSFGGGPVRSFLSHLHFNFTAGRLPQEAIEVCEHHRATRRIKNMKRKLQDNAHTIDIVNNNIKKARIAMKPLEDKIEKNERRMQELLETDRKYKDLIEEAKIKIQANL